MAEELFETQSVSYNDVVRDYEKAEGLPMAVGTYTAGQIVCSNAGANFADTDILLSTVAGYNTQTIAVILEDVTIANAGDIAIGTYEAKINRAVATLPTGQTEAEVNGILQAKNLYLEDWSK